MRAPNTVEILNNAQVNENPTSIVQNKDWFELYVWINKEATLVARSFSARRLCDFALGAGAVGCKFDFDLKHER